jgi:hypothetical protein
MLMILVLPHWRQMITRHSPHLVPVQKILLAGDWMLLNLEVQAHLVHGVQCHLLQLQWLD